MRSLDDDAIVESDGILGASAGSIEDIVSDGALMEPHADSPASSIADNFAASASSSLDCAWSACNCSAICARVTI